MRYTKSSTKRKFIAMNTFIKKEKRSQINNLILHLKELEKEEQTNFTVGRRKEIIKIRVGINQIETRKTTEKKSTKLRVGFLKKYTK